MVSPFLQEFLERAVELNDFERAVLISIDARSYEDIDSIAHDSPSLVAAGMRPEVLIEAARPNLRPEYLRVVERLAREQPRVRLGAGNQMAAPLASRPTGRGSLLAVPTPTPLSGPSASLLDCRLKRWPVRNQANRETCVAFGVTACMEHFLYAAGDPTPDYSEQFLYWAIKTASRDPLKKSGGTRLCFAHDMLNEFGICDESLWKYVPTAVIPESGETLFDPTSSAKRQAATRRTTSVTYYPGFGGSAEIVLELLQKNRPVAVGLLVFGDKDLPDYMHDWVRRSAWDHGHIIEVSPEFVPKGGHCVCITGFVPDETETKGGFFIFRNSWGPKWAERAPDPGYLSPERGYGYVSAFYVDKYCTEILQIDNV